MSIVGKDIVIVGTGATQQGPGPVAFTIGAGAQVVVRGLTFDLTRGGLHCDPGSGLRASMTLRDVSLRDPVGAGRIEIRMCNATLLNVDLTSENQVIAALREGSMIDIDRSRITGSGGSALFILGTGAAQTIRASNSIFTGVPIQWTFADQTPPSSVTMAFNTFVSTAANNTLNCSDAANATIVVDNNVIAGVNSNEQVTGDACVLRQNIIYPQSTAIAGNIHEAPRLVDISNGDYRLRADSPAVDAAIDPSLDVSLDFSGTSRPQGPAKDIGAFEATP